MTAKQSRVPNVPDTDPAHQAFFDAVDRRQLSMSQLEDLASDATLADVVAKINAILATQRTR